MGFNRSGDLEATGSITTKTGEALPCLTTAPVAPFP